MDNMTKKKVELADTLRFAYTDYLKDRYGKVKPMNMPKKFIEDLYLFMFTCFKNSTENYRISEAEVGKIEAFKDNILKLVYRLKSIYESHDSLNGRDRVDVHLQSYEVVQIYDFLAFFYSYQKVMDIPANGENIFYDMFYVYIPDSLGIDPYKSDEKKLEEIRFKSKYRHNMPIYDHEVADFSGAMFKILYAEDKTLSNVDHKIISTLYSRFMDKLEKEQHMDRPENVMPIFGTPHIADVLVSNSDKYESMFRTKKTLEPKDH